MNFHPIAAGRKSCKSKAAISPGVRGARVCRGFLVESIGRAGNRRAGLIDYHAADLGPLIHGATVVFNMGIQGASVSSLSHQASGATFEIGNKIIPAVECAVRPALCTR